MLTRELEIPEQILVESEELSGHSYRTAAVIATNVCLSHHRRYDAD